MIFIHDTRDKPGKHDNVDSFLLAQGHKIVRSKLFVGDISLLDNQSVCIDLKQGLNEVESNLTHQHERFRAECIRAQENGIRLIVLVQEKGIQALDDVATWRNPRRTRWDKISQEHAFGRKLHIEISKKPPLSGETMAKQMRAMNERYQVEWAFCAKEETGRKICALLGVPPGC